MRYVIAMVLAACGGTEGTTVPFAGEYTLTSDTCMTPSGMTNGPLSLRATIPDRDDRELVIETEDETTGRGAGAFVVVEGAIETERVEVVSILPGSEGQTLITFNPAELTLQPGDTVEGDVDVAIPVRGACTLHLTLTPL